MEKIDANVNTNSVKDLCWARIPTLKTNLGQIPRVLQVSDGELRYWVSIIVEKEWDTNMQERSSHRNASRWKEKRFSEQKLYSDMAYLPDKTIIAIPDSNSNLFLDEEESRRSLRDGETLTREDVSTLQVKPLQVLSEGKFRNSKSMPMESANVDCFVKNT